MSVLESAWQSFVHAFSRVAFAVFGTIDSHAELVQENKRLNELNKFIYEGSAAQKVAGLEIELAAVKLRHDILIQADVVGHPPPQDICDPYPECEAEWLAAIIAWLSLDPMTDPDLLARWAERSTP